MNKKIKTKLNFTFTDIEIGEDGLINFVPREKKKKLYKIVTVKGKKDGRKDRKLF